MPAICARSPARACPRGSSTRSWPGSCDACSPSATLFIPSDLGQQDRSDSLRSGALLAAQREIEGGALSAGGLCPDAALVSGDDSAYGREADSGAGELCLAVQALEGREQAAGVLHFES